MNAPTTKTIRRRDTATAIDFLRRHEGAAGLLPAAERLVRLRQDLLAQLPATLRGLCDVSAVDDDTVSLRVPSASAAAKLRQTIPRLREGLLDRGWKVSAIRVRVQPAPSAEESITWKSPQGSDMSPAALSAFAALDRDIAGGESPLKAAVARLLVRRRVA